MNDVDQKTIWLAKPIAIIGINQGKVKFHSVKTSIFVVILRNLLKEIQYYIG